MATLKNSLLQGLNGVVGSFLFRNVRGKTIVSIRRKKLPRNWKKRQSPAQKLTRDRFSAAARYAKAQMDVPAIREHYKELARKLKLPNGYTAAITEYMRTTNVESVNTKRYTGKVGGSISITARKKDFSLEGVNVTLTTKEGKEIEKGKAERMTSGQWIYRNIIHSTSPEDVVVLVETNDRIGNKTRATLNAHKELSCSYWMRGVYR